MTDWTRTPDPDLTGIDVDTSAPVLVTGATGYVAGWVVKGLLDAGATVHAAVRHPEDAATVGHLTALAEATHARGTGARLRLFASDLLQPGSYDEAMAGCAVVLHTASPFVRGAEDPQRDLVDPAVRGTRNVLTSVEATASVRRVVLTSSIAATYTDAVECAAAPGGRLTEEVWNTTASLTYEPYSHSKTLAERAAWEMADGAAAAAADRGEEARWRLVTVNPGLVVGPALGPGRSSDSFAILRQVTDGSLRLGAPRVGLALVDVRDVARAHIAAAYLPGAHGRHLANAHTTDLVQIGQLLTPVVRGRADADRFHLPGRALPKALVKAVGPALGLSRRYVEGNVDHPMLVSNAQSRRELGMSYRPLLESLTDMLDQL